MPRPRSMQKENTCKKKHTRTVRVVELIRQGDDGLQMLSSESRATYIQSTTPSGSSPRPNPPSPLGSTFFCFFFCPGDQVNYQPAGTNLGRPTNRPLEHCVVHFFFFLASKPFSLPLHNHHVLSDRPLYNTRKSSSSSASYHGAKEGPHASMYIVGHKKKSKTMRELVPPLSHPSHLHTVCAHFCKRTLSLGG